MVYEGEGMYVSQWCDIFCGMLRMCKSTHAHTGAAVLLHQSGDI